jgi:acyl carrier protein
MRRPSEEALLDFVRRRMLKSRSETVGPETKLFAERVIDSMNVLGLIGYVEQKLGRRLATDELVMANFASVRTICERFLGDAASD